MADWPTPSLPWFNVKDYGATGDGSTNDQSAIDLALTAANATSPKGVALFPPGTYIVDRLVLKCHLLGFSRRDTLIKSKATNTTADGTAVITSDDTLGGVSDMTIVGLGIDGNETNNAGKVIHGLESEKTIRVSRIAVENCTGSGINHLAGNGSEWTDVVVRTVDGHGIKNVDEDQKFTNVLISEAGLTGFYTTGGVRVTGMIVGNSGLVDASTYGDGFYIGSGNARLFACQSNDNARNGVTFEGSTVGGYFQGFLRENEGVGVLVDDCTDLDVNVYLQGSASKKHTHIVQLTGTNSRNRVVAHYNNNALVGAATAVDGTTTGNDIWAAQGDAPSGLVEQAHGATAGTARPVTSGRVMWIGTVTPTNALDGDIWIDTT